MSDRDFDVYLARASNLSQRYREVATDKPSQAIDSAILTASRRAPAPVIAAPQSWFKRWRVPMSIAAVMMLGVGITWRTVLEESKISSPPLAVPPPKPVRSAAPAASVDTAPKAASSASESAAGASSNAAPAATAPDLAKKKESRTIVEEVIIEKEPARIYPAPPPNLQQDKKAREMPLPAPSIIAPRSNDASEKQAGSASSGIDLGKLKAAAPPQRDDAALESAPKTAKKEADAAPRQREPEAIKPAEHESRAAPAMDAASPEARQAFPGDGPRLPEGHRPVVDGKSYRGEKSQAESHAVKKESKTDALSDTVEESPEVWLRRVAELRRQGQRDEANAELERFRKRYPNYPAPLEN